MLLERAEVAQIVLVQEDVAAVPAVEARLQLLLEEARLAAGDGGGDGEEV